jgi:uncharacterized membrane-anchored protein
MTQMGVVIKPEKYFIMSNPENKNDGETSRYIKTILVVIGCVILWIVLQSIIGVPMKM